MKRATRFLGPPSKAVARWLFAAIFAQVLVAVALALFDENVEGLRANLDAWIEQGQGATLAVGLLAAAIAETLLRSGPLGKAHVILAVVGTGAIFYAAGKYGDVLRGAGSPNDARDVSAGIMLTAALVGGTTAFLNAVDERQEAREKQP